MATKFEEIAVVVSQKEIATDIYDLTIQTKEIAAAAKAGQFISLYCNDGTKLLPRPISLCGIDREAGTLRMVYRVTGENTGTKQFSDKIRMIASLEEDNLDYYVMDLYEKSSTMGTINYWMKKIQKTEKPLVNSVIIQH